MSKFLKLVGAVVLGLNLVGCATSISSAGSRVISNKNSGYIYGPAWVATKENAKDACLAINNIDERCSNPENYILVTVVSKIGFSDGLIGVTALAPKNLKNLDALRHEMVTGSKNIPYVKASVSAGKLGDIIEVVSTNGDGKCRWSGMPRAGGTVCDGAYDYRKDFTGVDLRFM